MNGRRSFVANSQGIKQLCIILSVVPGGTRLGVGGRCPTDKSVGYFHLSLRDINTKRVLQILVALPEDERTPP